VWRRRGKSPWWLGIRLVIFERREKWRNRIIPVSPFSGENGTFTASFLDENIGTTAGEAVA